MYLLIQISSDTQREAFHSNQPVAVTSKPRTSMSSIRQDHPTPSSSSLVVPWHGLSRSIPSITYDSFPPSSRLVAVDVPLLMSSSCSSRIEGCLRTRSILFHYMSPRAASTSLGNNKHLPPRRYFDGVIGGKAASQACVSQTSCIGLLPDLLRLLATLDPLRASGRAQR